MPPTFQTLPDNLKVFWISSYPRSGNLWLRNIVRDILIPDADAVTDVNAFFPDIHRGFEKGIFPVSIPAFGSQPVVVMKNHYPYTACLPYGDKTVGALYVVRHPLDAIISEVKYLLATDSKTLEKGPEHIEWFINDLISQVNLFGGSKSNIELDFGTWADNVSSWLTLHRSFPVHLIRYEDLISTPTETIEGVAKFLGITLDRWKAMYIAKSNCRESMKRKQEVAISQGIESDFFRLEYENSIKQGYRYITDNKDFQYLHLLSADRFNEAMRIFAPILRWLRYSESDIYRYAEDFS